MSKSILAASAAALVALALTASPAAAAIVQNGSFETLAGPFHNDSFNYEQLGDGSTFITNWTVSTSSGHIALAQSVTGDGHSAPDGTYFVDLSGFSSESPDGALSQSIHTVAGATYAFTMDLYSGNNGSVRAWVGGNAIALSAGASFTVGNDTWTPFSGTFTGDALNHSPVLTIGHTTPGSDVDFVDNISIVQTGGGGVPEPAAWGLMILGFGGVGAAMRRRAAAFAA